MIEDVEHFIALIPSDAGGVVFLDGDQPVQPALLYLENYQRRAGARRGFRPSSSEISNAMLEHYQRTNFQTASHR